MTAIAAASAPKLRLTRPDELARSLQAGGIESFQAQKGFAACLLPLLRALGWRGDPNIIAEALPHFASDIRLDEFRNVLANLHYKSQPTRTAALDITPHLLPCFHVAADGSPCVVLERQGDTFKVFDGASGSRRELALTELRGVFYLIAPAELLEEEHKNRRDNWMRQMLARFRPFFWKLLGLTFVLNLLPLGVPLFIMVLYDLVIPARSAHTLIWLGAGLALVFLFELALTGMRARLLAYIAGRVENILSAAVLRRILLLPTGFTESASTGAQVARLRQLESVREVFSGPLASAALEIPFILVFLLAVILLAGSLAFIPLAVMGGFAVLAALTLRTLNNTVTEAGRARSERNAFLVEAMSELRVIQEAGAADTWRDRYRNLSANAAYQNFRQARISFLVQTLSTAFMTLAGVATIAWGVDAVIRGTLSVGALIASMALVWRILSPIQNLFMALARGHMVRQAVEQINGLMRLASEDDELPQNRALRTFRGHIGFSRVGFRYNSVGEPALNGLSFEVKPGEILAITGPNGAGKSTVLSLILGLYRPQAGLITMDGIDTRQLHPQELRRAIAYVPQHAELFHGTIAQNLRLAAPTASDQALRQACADAGVLDDILALPQGFETRIGDQNTLSYNAGFRTCLAVARALLKNAPVLLLDEVGQALDHAGDAHFQTTLKRLKGRTTVIMVSHRPSHIRIADCVLAMNAGRLTQIGRPEDILDSAQTSSNQGLLK